MTDVNKISHRIDKAISEFNGSFMSDAKWRKIFKALIEEKVAIKAFDLKYVRDETIRRGSGILFESAFEESFNDNGFKDPGVGGPALFKEIEWIEFEHDLEFRRHHSDPEMSLNKRIQSIDSIIELLDRHGKFEYEREINSLRIYGYK